jgi:PadR family transcriptional regulator PadR
MLLLLRQTCYIRRSNARRSKIKESGEHMISSDIIRGYIDTMILYLLLNEPSYGYEISKKIKELTDEKYIMKETTLYSAFKRMEANGYIESYMGS